MFKLDDKIAIVTGAASGIGKSVSQLFAQQGAHVFLFDIDIEEAQSVAKSIQEMGGKANAVGVNVADGASVKSAVAQVVQTAGAIHILVNNAGIAHIGNADNTAESDFDKVYQINVKGLYHCLHEVIPVMKNTGGAILNMCSIAASVGLQDRFAYSMSKGAVLGITLSVARDYLAHHIRCNCISPARIHTPFVDGFIQKNYPGKEQEVFEKLSKSQPIGRMGTTDEVAALVLYLCSNEAAFITGTDYPIDGGFITLNN